MTFFTDSGNVFVKIITPTLEKVYRLYITEFRTPTEVFSLHLYPPLHTLNPQVIKYIFSIIRVPNVNESMIYTSHHV